MLVSGHIETLLKYGDYKNAIKSMKEAGFPAFDLSINPKPWPLPESFFIRTKTFKEILAETKDDREWVSVELAKELRKYADEIGIVCNQTHAPYPTAWVGDEPYNEDVFKLLVESLEITAIMGAKVCVLHPCNDYTPKENVENVYIKLLPYAKKFGVLVGVENMWNWDRVRNIALPAACSSAENFKAHMDLLPEEYFCACVDTGHAEMGGLATSAYDMIKTLGKRVKALHVHDNDLFNDDHALPYLGKIDFEKIYQALNEIGYDGDVTFEVGNFLSSFPDELYMEALKFMAKVGEYIKSRLGK